MYKTLRIIFTVIAAIFAGAALPLGYLLEGNHALIGALSCVCLAFVFFGLMMVCKKNQELDERACKRNTDIPYPSPDENAEKQKTDKKE